MKIYVPIFAVIRLNEVGLIKPENVLFHSHQSDVSLVHSSLPGKEGEGNGKGKLGEGKTMVYIIQHVPMELIPSS